MKVQREKFSVAGERGWGPMVEGEKDLILYFFPCESPFHVKILELLRLVTRSLLDCSMNRLLSWLFPCSIIQEGRAHILLISESLVSDKKVN